MSGWLASPRAPRVVVAIGVLFTLPALTVGFVHDDLLHRLALEDGIPEYALGPHELYDFTGEDVATVPRMIELGYLPWFTDPELRLRFFRPISSLLLALDSALFGRDAVLAHAHSLLWFLLMAIVVASIHRRALSPVAATVASAIYAVAGAHAMTTGWLAARHTLVGACFGAICVWAHLRWRDGGWRSGAIVAPLALVLGMLSSETALGAVVFVLLYELIVRREDVARRALAALPVFALGLAHLVFYALAGYGTKNSGAYISPFHEPLAFAEAIVTRGPLLVAEMFGAFPVLAAAIDPAMGAPVGIYGALVCAMCAFVLWRARAELDVDEGRRLLWLGTASIVCLAPMVGGVLGPRLLPLALVGSSAIVGATIVVAWRSARSRASLGSRLALRAPVIALVLLHFVLSPLVRASLPAFLDTMSEGERDLAVRADLSACADGAHAYLLTGADPSISLYAAQSLLFYERHEVTRLAQPRVLSMVAAGQELTVRDDDTFELAVLRDGPREASMFERVYRADPLAPGDRVVAGELGASVIEVDGGFPTKVSFDVEGGLANVCFLVWRDGRLQSMPPPDPGEPRTIVHELGPMGM